MAAGPVKEGSLVNLHGLIEEYGVTAEEGVVVEGDREHYALQTPYALLPEMESSSITDPLIEEHYYPILPLVEGLKVDETEAAGRVTTLLQPQRKPSARQPVIIFPPMKGRRGY